ncbi:MAG: FIST domain containing protein [Rhodospirillaceae bacterium BRH_c57]|nr:MAG: FIST domain containing protein [Rhodospirillaceae bacterium BRH_c57]
MRENIQGILRGSTTAQDADQAAADLVVALGQPDLHLVVVFAAATYDVHRLAACLQERFGRQVPVVGCTTAGEITPEGFHNAAVTGFSLGGPDFAAGVELIENLQSFNVAEGHAIVRRALQKVVRQAPHTSRERMFALTLIDGMSGSEEAVISALHAALGEIPLCGGSAGDGLRFQETFVFHQGRAVRDCALLILISTMLPFRVFKTEHFEATSEKVVVTGADPARRIVSEVNAEPAAREYARVVGLDVANLTPMIFATHPVVVRVGGTNFVRSIQKVNEDESLTFFCAIDEGIVLTVAKGIDLADNLDGLFVDIQAHLGPPELVIGFDCILRNLEIDQKGLRARVSATLSKNRVVGFATYGEQYQAMHVNQTFTGVAIGRRGGGDTGQ